MCKKGKMLTKRLRGFVLVVSFTHGRTLHTIFHGSKKRKTSLLYATAAPFFFFHKLSVVKVTFEFDVDSSSVRVGVVPMSSL